MSRARLQRGIRPCWRRAACATPPSSRQSKRHQAGSDPVEIGGAKCAVSFSRLLRREIYRQARRDVLGAPIDTDALCQPRQRAAEQGVAFDVDLLAASQAPFEILGQNTGSRKPPDQLPTRFRTQVSAALIDQNGSNDVTEAPSDAKPSISLGQRLRTTGIVLPARNPAANRPLFGSSKLN